MEEEISTSPRGGNSSSEKGNSLESFLPSYSPDPIYSAKNFEIKYNKQLGSGTFSKVFLATNVINNKDYAVKRISKSLVKSNGATDDLVENEISIHERIVHPNIIKMYSHSQDNEYYYAFLEYISGDTLRKNLKKGGMKEKDAFKVFFQCAKAIQFCHENQLLFRDVKLENFLYDKSTGVVKLCDFGLCAQLTSEEPMRLTFCGTYQYMAPELIKKEDDPYDLSVDIWALGVVLFELTHGYSPFSSNENAEYPEVYKNVISMNYHIEKEITNNCKDLIKKMLTPDPEKRISIEGVINHPWMKDWAKSKEETKAKGKEDKMFYDVLDAAEKKNKTKKKKKDKGKAGFVYKKVSSTKKKENEPKKTNLSNEDSNKKNDSLVFSAENNEEEDKAEDWINSKSPIIKRDFDSPIIKRDEENVEEKGDLEVDEGSEELRRSPIKETNNLLDMIDGVDDSMQGKEDDDDHKYYSHQYDEYKNASFNAETNYNGNYHNYSYNEKLEKESLESTLNMFAKAEKLKNEAKKHQIKEKEGFWGRLFAPFRCGSNEN